MSLQYIHYPTNGSGSGSVPTYANFASLPTGVADGSLAVTLDTHTLYIYDSGTMTWSPVTGGGSGYNVNLFTLDSTDIANKFVTLSAAPTTPGHTIVDVRGGPQQNYTDDYVVSGSQLSWSGLGLEALLSSGDKLVVQFN